MKWVLWHLLQVWIVVSMIITGSVSDQQLSEPLIWTATVNV